MSKRARTLILGQCHLGPTERLSRPLDREREGGLSKRRRRRAPGRTTGFDKERARRVLCTTVVIGLVLTGTGADAVDPSPDPNRLIDQTTLLGDVFCDKDGDGRRDSG